MKQSVPLRESLLRLLSARPDGLHYRQIAELLGIPEGTIRVSLSRMVQKGDVTRVGEGCYKTDVTKDVTRLETDVTDQDIGLVTTSVTVSVTRFGESVTEDVTDLSVGSVTELQQLRALAQSVRERMQNLSTVTHGEWDRFRDQLCADDDRLAEGMRALGVRLEDLGWKLDQKLKWVAFT